MELINRFGRRKGFEILHNRFIVAPSEGRPLSFPVISALIRPFGQCHDVLTTETVQTYFLPIVVCLITPSSLFYKYFQVLRSHSVSKCMEILLSKYLCHFITRCSYNFFLGYGFHHQSVSQSIVLLTDLIYLRPPGCRNKIPGETVR